MSALNFSDMRDALRTISDVVGPGYLIGCAWDGTLMRLTVGRVADPESWRPPYAMTFDSDSDYLLDPAKLMASFVPTIRAYFGSEKDKADEISRLLNLAAAK